MGLQLTWEDLASARRGVAPRHGFADDPSGLRRVLEPTMNLCIWRRALGTGLAAWLDRVAAEVDLHAQDELASEGPQAGSLVAALPPGEHRETLRADIETLVCHYGALTGAPRTLVTFARVTHDMCRRFHVDSVGLRALCTYAGAGTQWVPEHAALRGGLARPGLALRDANLAVVPREGDVCALERGWVGIFKGEAWPGNRGFGAIHRSPPVGATGAPRLLLKLDLDPERRLRR